MEIKLHLAGKGYSGRNLAVYLVSNVNLTCYIFTDLQPQDFIKEIQSDVQKAPDKVKPQIVNLENGGSATMSFFCQWT